MDWYAASNAADGDFTDTVGHLGEPDLFKVRGPHGAHAIGSVRNADMPNERGHPERGELFYLEVPEGSRRRGLGLATAIRALRLIRAHGSKTVAMNAVSPGGRAMIAKLIDVGAISGPLRQTPSGKAEYLISLQNEAQNTLP